MNQVKKALLILVVIASSVGCQNKNSKPNPELLSIDLLRGDIAFCGNPDFGELSFSLSCDFSSRETFDLAISLLHSFEYAEAEKAFVKVIDADPECAMAYWGVSMSLYHSLWAPPGPTELEKGSKLLQIAEALPKTRRAAAYIDAMNAFYNNWETVDHDTRQELYEKKMASIYADQKDDSEAAIFYALAVRASADPSDRTYKKQREAGEILETLFKDQPNHPGIAHYIIHCYDYPEIAELALSTARRYAEIAPASAHAQHMPSHIFTRLGLWEESINTNINSVSSAVCYSQGTGSEGNWAQELHAMDYLVYGYLQLGDNAKANEQNDYLKSMKKIFPLNNFAAAYAATAIPARIALENKQWSKAAKLKRAKIEFDWKPFPWEQSILHFARAIGFVRSGDVESTEKELEIMQALRQELLAENSATTSYQASQVNVEIKTTEAWIEFAKGNSDKAIELMNAAVDLESNTTKHPVTPGEVLPANQLLGDMYIELNDPENAIRAYESDLTNHPNRFNSIYGAAIAAKKLGDNEKASNYFKELVQLVGTVNSDRKELKEAKEYLNI
jgi:tetratricopeptide (TPR) repeat protein